MLEIKNAVVVVLIFLKHNGLCGRLAESNHFYTEESKICTNLRVRTTLFELSARYVHGRNVHAICEGLFVKHWLHNIMGAVLRDGIQSWPCKAAR